MIVRGVMVVVSVAAIAWIGVWLHSARLEARAIELATPVAGRAPTPAQLAEAQDLLVRAREHNADTRPIVLEAQLAAFSGRPAAAIPLLQEVVRREPDNVLAWRLLAQLARGRDLRLAALAERRLREISPPVNAGP